MCTYVHFAWKDRLRNDLYCDEWNIKLYTLPLALSYNASIYASKLCPCRGWSAGSTCYE